MRGHETDCHDGEVLLYFPGSAEELRGLLSSGSYRRVVVRSSAIAYGVSVKNPGFISESRTSLLSADSLDRSWLSLEEAAASSPSHAAIRLSTVGDTEEGDRLAGRYAGRLVVSILGRDPNVQFVHLLDAAAVLAAAVESDSTGVFNAAGEGVIPLREADRAAGMIRVPLPKWLASILTSRAAVEQLDFNYTVSCERAKRDLGFTPSFSSLQALHDLISSKRKPDPELLQRCYDDWGLDTKYLHAWHWWFAFLRKVYWRIDFEGIEHVPERGPALFVSNHRGFMPLDAVMHLSLVQHEVGRIIRFLIIPSLLKMPFLSNFLTRVGGVVASQENATRLFAGGNIVGIFPEGIRGAFTPYHEAYLLRDFSKSAFARIAVENQVPILPAAVVGHAEIFPILARINWGYMTREWGWPYFPIAPMFPLAPVPIPSKWHIRYLPPIPVNGLSRTDAANPVLMREFSRHVQEVIQVHVDEIVNRRKHIFFGRLLNGSAPVVPSFEPTRSRSQR
jgi:1-acyl-sn-glycerol-3-phosphate acyltransferase